MTSSTLDHMRNHHHGLLAQVSSTGSPAAAIAKETHSADLRIPRERASLLCGGREASDARQPTTTPRSGLDEFCFGFWICLDSTNQGASLHSSGANLNPDLLSSVLLGFVAFCNKSCNYLEKPYVRHAITFYLFFQSIAIDCKICQNLSDIHMFS